MAAAQVTAAEADTPDAAGVSPEASSSLWGDPVLAGLNLLEGYEDDDERDWQPAVDVEAVLTELVRSG